MKKVSLLLGALGGAMAGYLFSNEKLRSELSEAKDAEAAGKILAKHLQTDGKQVGHEIKRFATSPEVKDNMVKAKKYVQKQAKKLQSDMKTFMTKSKSAAKKTVKTAAAKTKKTVARASKKAKKFVAKNV